MKYYYAIVSCNSQQTAFSLIDEFNGFEFENTNIKLNMSFVPDHIKFEQEVKDEVDTVPEDYDYQLNCFNRALGHTSVKLTWDQDDKSRQQKLAMASKIDPNDSDAEDKYYRQFIAPASEDDDSKSGSDQDIDEYRSKLLTGMAKGGKRKDSEVDLENINSSDLDSDGELKTTPDIQFTTGFGEDIGKKL